MLWRFVQLTDPHLGSQVDGEWNNRVICTMMPDVMSCLRRDLAELNPEFILATGDLASQQTCDAMFAARDLLDSLGYPYYPMGGNHDFVLPESRQWFLDAFQAHLPSRQTFYSFTYRDLHFAVLDPWWKWPDGRITPHMNGNEKHAGWEVPGEQLEWLAADLDAHSSLPTLIAVHYPAVPIPQRMHRPSFMNNGFLANGAQLIRLLKARPQVRAVFSGHSHMNYVVHDEGLVHIITSALPEYPIEYRDVQVYEDRLEVRTLGLSNASFAARSLIEGREWTAGEEQDRSVTIPLRPQKRV
jgi:3',5'-cyclic AMP phosphodiesterase CpdA